MRDTVEAMIGPEVKHLASLLGELPRIDILRTLAGEPQSEAALAQSLGFPGYELRPHLQALHEHGVLAIDDDGCWSITPRAKVRRGERQLTMRFDLPDGSQMTLGLNRHPD